MEPDKIMEGISAELLAALKDMAKARNADEKLKYSQIVKNLCDSLGMFIELANSMMPFEEDEGGPLSF